MNDTVNDAVFQEVLDNLTRITEPSRDKRNKPQLDDFRNLISDATDVFVRKTTIKEKELHVRFILLSQAVYSRVKAWFYFIYTQRYGLISLVVSKEQSTHIYTLPHGINFLYWHIERIISLLTAELTAALSLGTMLSL